MTQFNFLTTSSATNLQHKVLKGEWRDVTNPVELCAILEDQGIVYVDYCLDYYSCNVYFSAVESGDWNFEFYYITPVRTWNAAVKLQYVEREKVNWQKEGF